MINILDKHNCSGCSACVSVCPKMCISFQPDKEGFLYPQVNASNCIECGLCEKVCPFQDSPKERLPIKSLAAINPDYWERNQSSSGGIFSMLAHKVLNDGGVVFGAAFDDDWSVKHIAIERTGDLHRLQGSKYVQSSIGNAFHSVKENLVQGRKVLFSGTPCQVAGLKKYLRTDYENLLTVDIICHGVPSPMVWQDYLSCLGDKKTICDIHFRDKCNGWINYSVSISYGEEKAIGEPFYANLFMRGFLNNLYLRPSCYKCKVKGGRSGSDITLGDFWGIENVVPEIHDDQGVSAVLANTPRGQRMLESITPIMQEVRFEQVVQDNPSLVESVPETQGRAEFWRRFQRGDGLTKSVEMALWRQKPAAKRVWKRFTRSVKRLLGLS